MPQPRWNPSSHTRSGGRDRKQPERRAALLVTPVEAHGLVLSGAPKKVLLNRDGKKFLELEVLEFKLSETVDANEFNIS